MTDPTLQRLVQRLLAERADDSHWTGELSSSALSTATAVVALRLGGSDHRLVDAGIDWLERHQNQDGGWGDTTASISNISTTALCWAAFSIARPKSSAASAAEKWMHRAAGSLDADRLVQAIASRYGNDRTFSVPILMVLAVAGLVPWRLVPQLPFELAAFPQSWFQWLGLPVVSYALPALIAIGHARHRLRPSRNPVARLARNVAARKTLRVLDRIQPDGGGFLEATPLTSFVAISLQVGGEAGRPVLARALEFLRRSMRRDGSWPIDTDLSMWLTTLSVNALGHRVPAEDAARICAWIAGRQYREIHPYTGAAPGGWAWTDLPGGVPDADDTAGALLALRKLGGPVDAAARGIQWLLDLQNRDGGIPTFCRGWTNLPFDRSSPDITAHALLAFTRWRSALDRKLQTRLESASTRALEFLSKNQRADGAWIPLWFGNQCVANDENPVYGTSRVLIALGEVQPDSQTCPMCRSGVEWLMAAQNPDGGWGGDRKITSTIEETSVAVAALTVAGGSAARTSVANGTAWLVRATQEGRETPPSPIGFYFARLWYFERLYPLIFVIDALTRVSGR